MKLRVSSSVIGFKKRAERIWGLKEWEGIDDPDKEVIFFGLYHERDFAVFELDYKKRIVFWCGSDIQRVIADYERRRILRNYPDTEHYCENEVEAEELRSIGINPIVIPSFLDNINDFPVSFDPPVQYMNGTELQQPCHVWICAHPEREEEYGVTLVKRIAEMYPIDLVFHVYGVEKQAYDKDLPNVLYHGQVEEEKFNEEIRKYHCGFRPNQHDGFSEVIIKSVLLGQYPISRIKYENIWHYTNEAELKECFDKLIKQKKPNLEARSYWVKKINQFPFCNKTYYEPDKEQ